MEQDITAIIKGDRTVVELSTLAPAPYNPHDITESDIHTVASSIREFGYLENIIVNRQTGHIVAGHTRILALREAGFERAEVVFIDVDEVREKRLNIILNHQAIYDPMKMGDLLRDLEQEGVNIDSLGLNERDLDKWIKSREIDIDDEEDQDDWGSIVNSNPITRLGETIPLGRHTLICGDATDPKNYESLTSDRPVKAFYSPPYNIGALNVKGDKNTQDKYLEGDDKLPDPEYFSILQDSLTNCLAKCDEVFINIMIAGDNKGPILYLLSSNAEQLKDIIYWVKSSAAPHISPGVMNNRVELILAFGNGKRKFAHAQWTQGSMPNIIEGDLNRLNPFHNVHKAVFPLYLPSYFIEKFSTPDTVIVDPFGGTGTTLIAAERTGRTCLMIEKNPHYCDIIRERFKREIEGTNEEEKVI